MWGCEKGSLTVSIKLVVVGLLVSYGLVVEALFCDRAPAGVNVPKLPGDNGYKIVIRGDPKKYIPEAVYTVRLQGPGDQYTVKKFSGFLLVVEPADALSPASAGTFQLVGDSLARFSEYCPHAVKHASELPKAEVQVRWTAPPASAGCVSFRATIIKNKGQWFMDDGELTKTLCPETDVGPDESETSEPCTACDEAKYELTFEGLWSPLTHPKDFPADAWSAHFSDIIGASHSPSFHFWRKDGNASEGLKQFAENGDSKDLERELKDESGSIRTIIKARGLRHPNFYGHKTFAVFRADKYHNLISLVSKIAPSPDWFVGVSGLNLCLRNGSWITGKTIQLYPWDAGTDNGVTYLSPKDSTLPQDRIHGISWQDDERSPFSDSSGTVKPFARLRISKQRSYETSCPEHSEVHGGVDGRGGGGGLTDYDDNDDYDDADDRDKPECETTDWSLWTTCSSAASCGRGTQKSYRRYKNEPKAIEDGCNRQMTRERRCEVPCSTNYDGYPRTGYRSSYGGGGASGIDQGMDPCAMTEFRPWGGCSATCGQGIRRRYREFVYYDLARSNGCDSTLLSESERCTGAFPSCMEAEEIRPGCETTDWSPWGPCNATCGKGMQIRDRLYANPPPHTDCKVNMRQEQSCEGTGCTAQEICNQRVDVHQCISPVHKKYHYDVDSQICKEFAYGGCGGTQNIFDSKDACEETCGSIVKLQSDSMDGYHQRHQQSKWNTYPTNHHSHSFHTHPYQSNRYQHNTNNNNNPFSRMPDANSYSFYQNYGPVGSTGGGRHTPSSTLSSSSSSYSSYGPPMDCEVSDWTPWSKCSVACGRGHKYRTRYIKVPSQNGGAQCPHLDHKRKCKGTQCPPNHPFRYQQHHGPSFDG